MDEISTKIKWKKKNLFYIGLFQKKTKQGVEDMEFPGVSKK